MNIFSKSIMLMIVLALGSLCAKAYTDATTGLVFSIANGNATILNSSGTTDAVTTNYTESIIVIPKTVTDKDDPSVTGTVTTIGAYAFQNCSALEEITLPATLTTIGTEAFRGTSKLKKVHIASIESYLGIKMGNEYSSPTRLGVDKVIGLYIDGELLTDLVIPEGFTETKAYSFAGNHSLKSVKLPSTLKTLGQFSFFGCIYIESVDLANVETIGNYAFSSSNTTLACKSLKSLRIPSTCKTIGTGAFYYCVSLEELVFEPEGVLTTIGNNAFRCNASNKNAKINSISLPKSVTTLGTNVFDYFTALETFETYGTVIPSLSTSTNLKKLRLQSPTYVSKPSDIPSGITIIVPPSLYETYAASAEWEGFNIKPLKTELKADILDVEFKPGNGGAEDISESNYTVTAYGDAHGEYNPHFGKYIGVTDNTPGTTGNNFYRINYASGDPIYSTLPNGFTFETVLQVTQAPSSSSETKWFSSTSSGGVAMLCTGTQFEIVLNTTASGSKTWKRSRSAITPKVNDFYHVIGVWDKENEMLNLYINGKLAKSVAAPGNFNWPATAVNYWFSIGGSSSATVGSSSNSGSWKFAAQRIYSDVLDAVDVTRLYGDVSASIAAANTFESLKAFVATEKTFDYNSDPTVLPSSLVPYKNAMQAAEQVIAEIEAKTSGEGKTTEEYLALKQAILDAKDKFHTNIEVIEGAATISSTVELTSKTYGNLISQIDASSVNSIDLSSIENLTLEPATIKNASFGPNTLYYLPDDYTKNVPQNFVIGTQCANLVITDGKPFAAPADFTATTASYERTMPNGSTWGTICLPYEVSSDETTKYYISGSIGDGVLNLTEAETVPAGTPAIFQTNATTLEAIGAGDVKANLKNATSDITLIGTYAPITVTDANAYYIKSNKFWRRAAQKDGYFTVAPFRAYFTAANSASPTFNILVSEDDLTGINDFIEKSAQIVCYYDLQGNKYSAPRKGINIIEYSNGKTQTIIIK